MGWMMVAGRSGGATGSALIRLLSSLSTRVRTRQSAANGIAPVPHGAAE